MVHRKQEGEEAERWKRKFLDALEDHELREKALSNRIRLLRRGLLGVSLAGDGNDPVLDKQLAQLRSALRNDDRETGLELLLEHIEKSIIRLDNEKNSSSLALKEAFESALKELEQSPLPSTTRRQLKKFSRNLSVRLEDPQQHAGLIRQFIELLNESVQALKTHEVEALADQRSRNDEPGLWQRLFRSSARPAQNQGAGQTHDGAVSGEILSADNGYAAERDAPRSGHREMESASYIEVDEEQAPSARSKVSLEPADENEAALYQRPEHTEVRAASTQTYELNEAASVSSQRREVGPDVGNLDTEAPGSVPSARAAMEPGNAHAEDVQTGHGHQDDLRPDGLQGEAWQREGGQTGSGQREVWQQEDRQPQDRQQDNIQQDDNEPESIEGELIRDGSGLVEPGFSYISGHVEPLLLRILEAIHITGESVLLAESIRRHIVKGLNWYDFVAVLEEILNILRNVANEQRAEFQGFLSEVTEGLAQVQAFVDTSRKYADEASANDAELDARVREHISSISRAVESDAGLDVLKESVQSQIGAIITSLDGFRSSRSEQENRLSGEMQELIQRIGALETESRELRRHLAQQQATAHRDALTELPNRDAYNQRVQATLASWREGAGNERRDDDRAMCLAVADVDNFKHINDTYGHLAGDKVLKIISKELVSRVRDADFVARYGGEEFVIIMPGTRPADAEHVLNKVRQSIANIPFHFKERQLRITVSFGVTDALPEDSPETLFERADKALYQAKADGRNKVHRGR